MKKLLSFLIMTSLILPAAPGAAHVVLDPTPEPAPILEPTPTKQPLIHNAIQNIEAQQTKLAQQEVRHLYGSALGLAMGATGGLMMFVEEKGGLPYLAGWWIAFLGGVTLELSALGRMWEWRTSAASHAKIAENLETLKSLLPNEQTAQLEDDHKTLARLQQAFKMAQAIGAALTFPTLPLHRYLDYKNDTTSLLELSNALVFWGGAAILNVSAIARLLSFPFYQKVQDRIAQNLTALKGLEPQ